MIFVAIVIAIMVIVVIVVVLVVVVAVIIVRIAVSPKNRLREKSAVMGWCRRSLSSLSLALTSSRSFLGSGPNRGRSPVEW